ncbi:LysE family translocator [Vibrio sp. WXL103]|uniref:LysE family translocator n=1 Tax=Vibrio sp. WXL103 TaxID=3450710 RepID=UPI003EC68C74
MLEIFAYAIGIMYTPGPVNLLGLHSGLSRKTHSHLGFFVGVGSAMFILFMVLGYAGVQLINEQVLPLISLAGCAYIFFIAWKIAHANTDITEKDNDSKSLSFRDGLFMQLLNPKALLATLPISTIQFPSIGITGPMITLWSLVLAFLAFGAPTSYSLVGLILGKRISKPCYFKVFNWLMAVLLVYVSMIIGFEHIITPLLRSL